LFLALVDAFGGVKFQLKFTTEVIFQNGCYFGTERTGELVEFLLDVVLKLADLLETL